jgi:hypothetical protein
VVAIQKRDGPAGGENIVVRMRRKEQNSFVAQVLEPRLLPSAPDACRRQQEKS